MRKITRVFLLLFVFAVPWEYSLDFGEPFGNVARVAILLALPFALGATCNARRLRYLGSMQCLVAALFIYLCVTSLWTIDADESGARLRGYFQEMLIVWLGWEFAEHAPDLRNLFRAWVAGSWVLTILTIATLISPQSAGQIRFVPVGQNANDVARFLDLCMPLAALLLCSEQRWPWRLLAAGFLPLAFAGVLLTASRSGFLIALITLTGSCILLARRYPHGVWVGATTMVAVGAIVGNLTPRDTLHRLYTIPIQLANGGLNQRLNIWISGWQAFVHAPFFGTGAGSFVAATGLAPGDTAHNTALSLAIEGGVWAVILATAIVAIAVRCVLKTSGSVRIALATALSAWLVASVVSTVEETRTTWELLAVIALAARMWDEAPNEFVKCFSNKERGPMTLLKEVSC